MTTHTPAVLRRLIATGALTLLALATWLPGTARVSAQGSATLVISQVYGGGGNTGATLTHDFIEIFNPTASPVDVTGWSVQYASSGGTSWQRTLLAGVVPAGGYFLVQQAQGSGGSTPLPMADAIGTIPMAATSGKVALVSSSTTLAGGCPLADVVDFVGFGTSATCFEGVAAAPTLSNTTAALRAGNGCLDTNNNVADFATGAPLPRNSASPTQSCAPPTAVISQVFGGGGNAGAVYTHDFIEIFNPGPDSVSMTGWSVQYASSAGSSWQVTPINGSLPAGGYYLVQLAAGAGAVVPLPTPDATGTTNLSAASGKVALVASTAGLTGQCPSSPDLLDFVGFGVANCFEGLAAAPTLNNQTAAFRLQDGCVDTDDNRADFFADAAAPRNSAAPRRDCAVDPTPFVLIHEIQGAGATSPYDGQVVSTQGIVTGVKFNGFYLQSTPEDEDGDPQTSEGLLVFTGNGNVPPLAEVGHVLRLRGRVTEFARANAASVTELTSISGVELLADGATLPAPVPVTRADLTPDGGLLQLERLEGMRVSMDTLVAVSPTLGSTNEQQSTGTDNGIFFAVLAGEARPFREAGIQAPATPPVCAAGAPCAIPVFDANPERVRVDSRGQLGAPLLSVTTGTVISNVTGILDYDFGTWTIVPDPVPALTAVGGIVAAPAPAPGAEQFTVASFNLERLFDSVAPGPIVTPEALDRRLGKASQIIRDYLHTPDVLGVQEVENLAVLQALAARVNADAVAGGGPDPGYSAYLEEGNDVGGIDVGFLASARVTVHAFVQWGAGATYINPLNGQPELLNDRPSISLRGTITGPPSRLPADVIVVNNHLRSLLGMDEPGGERVRAKRAAQAEYLAGVLHQLQSAYPATPLVSVGDYNAFDMNDGYVDVLATIRGVPTPPEEVVVASPDLLDPDFANAAHLLPAGERYSYVFDGNAQSLDHVLYSTSAASSVAGFGHARVNADFPLSFKSDGTRPERVSDHDPALVAFWLPADTTPPQIQSLVPSATMLWPPNHQMVPITLTVSATDNRSTVTCAVTGVSSNEPVLGPGAGQTSPDWIIDGALRVSLRAERQGGGSGRIYTVTVACDDAAGNTTATHTTVTVPHSQGRRR
ncbi:MAG: lamin tail domain-containing protein [Vicinamibacterales bacterium]|nr:lamin tail domain-containing protein [Vicinamibacterales bacterium]